MYAVGRAANKFIVTVTGVKSDTDWFNNSYESKGQASGVIIADNGQELLILTERKAISGAQEMFVTFINDVTAPATMKKYDGNTGIAVLSVPRASLNDETLHAITVAELGDSLVATQGMMVIAVGSPLGTNYSILTEEYYLYDKQYLYDRQKLYGVYNGYCGQQSRQRCADRTRRGR